MENESYVECDLNYWIHEKDQMLHLFMTDEEENVTDQIMMTKELALSLAWKIFEEM